MNVYTQAAVEIAILFVVTYSLLKLMRGTRGEGLLRGLATVVFLGLVALALVAKVIDLPRISALLQQFLPVSVIGVLIIFQPEIRWGLIRLGQTPFLKRFLRSESRVIEEIVKATRRMSEAKIGGLIALEQAVGIESYIEKGEPIDAEVNASLIETIFYPGSLLHDGALIIRNGRIVAAGCLFPLTDNPELSRRFGTRHRAGIGVTEESDAIAVIVSEETGAISVAHRGRLLPDVGPMGLERFLRENLATGEAKPEAPVVGREAGAGK
ncbi:MAG: TIGR00159 family protein [Planctomycetes bacterium]|nr:TIGR00159 family protein [Planctomycetota bacterium]MBI3843095.1 TIGR00159 family protein [Planctomycetota bacterium]